MNELDVLMSIYTCNNDHNDFNRLMSNKEFRLIQINHLLKMYRHIKAMNNIYEI